MAPPALATATSAHRANATSPQRIGPVRAWVCAAHRTAQRTAPRSALHRANATSPQRIGPRMGPRSAAHRAPVRPPCMRFAFVLVWNHF